MTGVHHRFGWSIARARTAVELTVLVVGFLLGGTIGLGTLVFAFGIGPIVQWALGVFDPSGVVVRRRRAAIAEGPVPAAVPQVADGTLAVGVLESPAGVPPRSRSVMCIARDRRNRRPAGPYPTGITTIASIATARNSRLRYVIEYL